MKNKKLILLFVLIIIALFVFINKFMGKKPFKNLSSESIESITLELLPPDTKTILTEDEILKFTELANELVIYQEDNSYYEYAGQAVIFTITKTDGTQTTINAYTPFLIIDGVGYKTKYKPCNKLCSFANEISH